MVGELSGMMGVVGSGSETNGVPRSDESRSGEPVVLEPMLDGVTWVSVGTGGGERIGVRIVPTFVTMLLMPDKMEPSSLVRGKGMIPRPSLDVGAGVGAVTFVSVPVAGPGVAAAGLLGLLDGVRIDSTAGPADPTRDVKGVAMGVTMGDTTDTISDVNPPSGVARGVSTEFRPVPTLPSSEVRPPRSPPPFDELDVGVGRTCGAGVPGVPALILLLLSMMVERPTMMPVPVEDCFPGV